MTVETQPLSGDATSDASQPSTPPRPHQRPPTPTSHEPTEPEPNKVEASTKQEEEEEEARRRLQRPEDFEDSETRKVEQEPRKESSSPRRRAPKRARGRPPGSLVKKRRTLEQPSSSCSSGASSNGRPERSCKTTASTLMALSLEEEGIEIKFEESSSSEEEQEEDEDDRPLRRPRRKRRRSSQKAIAATTSSPNVEEESPSKAAEISIETPSQDEALFVSSVRDNSAEDSGAQPEVLKACRDDYEKESKDASESGHHPVVEEASSSPPPSSSSAAPEPQSVDSPESQEPLPQSPPGTPSKRGRGRPRLLEKRQTPSKAIVVATEEEIPKTEPQQQESQLPKPPANNKKSIKKKRRRKKFLLSKKKQRTPQNEKPLGRPRKDRQKPDSSKKCAGPKKQQRPTVLSAPLEELLPDLSPLKGCRPHPHTKRAISEKERAAQIVHEVTTAEAAFSCLAEGCGANFAHFSSLVAHRRDGHRSKNVFIYPEASGRQSREEGRHPDCSPDYSAFVSCAIRRVPETTFNSMWGTLAHINSHDARRFCREGGAEATSAVDKVSNHS